MDKTNKKNIFSKAFDIINFEILLYTLRYYGLRDTSLKPFKSYLSNWHQYVQYNNINLDFSKY